MITVPKLTLDDVKIILEARKCSVGCIFEGNRRIRADSGRTGTLQIKKSDLHASLMHADRLDTEPAKQALLKKRIFLSSR